MTEVRGVWIHESTCRGLGGARVARECHEHGLNLLLPKIPWLSGPTADPQYWQDVMDPMIGEAHKLDMEVHAWIFFLNEASVDGDKKLMQIQVSGKMEYSACAANPETVKRNLEKIEPILSQYDLDGFNIEDCFVYHRWPKDPLICFCDYCRESAPAGFQERLDWNRDKLTDLLKKIVKQSKKYSSCLKISVAARVPYETHSMPMSADWKQWCELGLLDYITPMIYQGSNDELSKMANDAMGLIAPTGVPVYIGLGAYIIDRELTGHEIPKQLFDQIEITRELKADGHIFYHMGGITQDQYIRMEQAYGM